MLQSFNYQPNTEEEFANSVKKDSTYDQWCDSAFDRIVADELKKAPNTNV